jgi:hypothetical protein
MGGQGQVAGHIGLIRHQPFFNTISSLVHFLTSSQTRSTGQLGIDVHSLNP